VKKRYCGSDLSIRELVKAKSWALVMGFAAPQIFSFSVAILQTQPGGENSERGLYA